MIAIIMLIIEIAVIEMIDLILLSDLIPIVGINSFIYLLTYLRCFLKKFITFLS